MRPVSYFFVKNSSCTSFILPINHHGHQAEQKYLQTNFHKCKKASMQKKPTNKYWIRKQNSYVYVNIGFLKTDC